MQRCPLWVNRVASSVRPALLLCPQLRTYCGVAANRRVSLPAVSSLGGFPTPAPGIGGAVVMGPALENLHNTGLHRTALGLNRQIFRARAFGRLAAKLTDMAAIWMRFAERAERQQPVAQLQQQIQFKKL